MRIDVLDHGYVELVGYMGGDLNVVNAARCSFGKNKLELDDSDFKLIKYLADNRHYSPFRHTQLQFLVKAPEFVMRQWYKHVVGISFSEGREVDHAWNELSMRYTNMADADFYTPETFRSQSKSNKQSSNDDSINPVVGTVWKPDPETLTMSGPREMLADELVKDMVASAKCAYESLIEGGVAKEQARMVLPMNIYTDVTWTVSLQGLANFIQLRDHEHSQYEIRVYAKALRELALKVAPYSVQALVGEE